MVTGAAAADAVARAKRLPSLRVGLHLALVEAAPASSPPDMPLLLGPDGAFRSDMARAGARMFFDPRARRQLAAEIAAQFAAFAKTGLPLDHLNAHKHFHLHPTIAHLACKIGRGHGLRAIRVPFEPAGLIEAIEPGSTGWGHRFLGIFAHGLRRRARRWGLWAPDRVMGLAWSGDMHAGRIRALIAALPAGISEIYSHPGLADAFPASAPGYRYRAEFEALVQPGLRQKLSEAGIRLGGYADFADP